MTFIVTWEDDEKPNSYGENILICETEEQALAIIKDRGFSIYSDTMETVEEG